MTAHLNNGFIKRQACHWRLLETSTSSLVLITSYSLFSNGLQRPPTLPTNHRSAHLLLKTWTIHTASFFSSPGSVMLWSFAHHTEGIMDSIQRLRVERCERRFTSRATLVNGEHGSGQTNNATMLIEQSRVPESQSPRVPSPTWFHLTGRRKFPSSAYLLLLALCHL